MFLINFKNGDTYKLDPISNPADVYFLDSPETVKQISRVSFLINGNRIDLPRIRKSYRVWIEIIKKDNVIKGEKLCIRIGRLQMNFIRYIFDNRIRIDLK